MAKLLAVLVLAVAGGMSPPGDAAADPPPSGPAAHLAGKLVEAGTQTPIAGADVIVFTGREICLSIPRAAPDGSCAAAMVVCRETLADFRHDLTDIALSRYLGHEAACPDPPLADSFTRVVERLRTDETGRFITTEMLRDGDYTLVYLKDGYHPRDEVFRNPQDVDIFTQRAMVPERCALSGTVTFAGGGPVEGALVEVFAENYEARHAALTRDATPQQPAPPASRLMFGRGGIAATDAAGRYCIPYLSGGRFEVSVQPPPGVVDRLWERVYLSHQRGQLEVEIPAPPAAGTRAEVTKDLVLPNVPLGSLVQGRVFARDTGNPVIARVLLMKEHHGMASITDAAYGLSDKDGAFTLRGVSAGKWKLSVIPIPRITATMNPADAEREWEKKYLMAESLVTIEQEGITVTVPDTRLRLDEPPVGAATAAWLRRAAGWIGAVTGAASPETAPPVPKPTAPPARAATQPVTNDDLTGSCAWSSEVYHTWLPEEPNLPYWESCKRETQYLGPNSALAYESSGPMGPGLAVPASEIQPYLDLDPGLGAEAFQRALAAKLADVLFTRALDETGVYLLGLLDWLPWGGKIKKAAMLGVRLALQLEKNKVKEALARTIFASGAKLSDWKIFFLDMSVGEFHVWSARECKEESPTCKVGFTPEAKCQWKVVPGVLPARGDSWEGSPLLTGHVLGIARVVLDFQEQRADGAHANLRLCSPFHGWSWYGVREKDNHAFIIMRPFTDGIANAKYLGELQVEAAMYKLGTEAITTKDAWSFPDDWYGGQNWNYSCGPKEETSSCPIRDDGYVCAPMPR